MAQVTIKIVTPKAPHLRPLVVVIELAADQNSDVTSVASSGANDDDSDHVELRGNLPARLDNSPELKNIETPNQNSIYLTFKQQERDNENPTD